MIIFASVQMCNPPAPSTHVLLNSPGIYISCFCIAVIKQMAEQLSEGYFLTYVLRPLI